MALFAGEGLACGFAPKKLLIAELLNYYLSSAVRSLPNMSQFGRR